MLLNYYLYLTQYMLLPEILNDHRLKFYSLIEKKQGAQLDTKMHLLFKYLENDNICINECTA